MHSRYTQECTAETANDEPIVAYVTLSIEGSLDDAKRSSIGDAVRRAGGTATWRSSATAGRSYALLEFPDRYDAAEIAAASGGTVYERPVIAVALFPEVAEALPSLLEALGGRGRPAGVLACSACPGGAIVEWDPSVTGAQLIVAIVDLELARFRSGRVTELLSPLPPALVAAVAAGGLQAPQIDLRRVLRLDRA